MQLSTLLKLIGIAVLFCAGNVQAIIITPDTNSTNLVNNILGAGVNLIGGTDSYTGTTNMAGTFTGGTDPVGFDSGVVLMTGDVNDIPGPNPTNSSQETEGAGFSGGPADPSQDRGQPGDADLSAIVGNSTFDASVLVFDFQFGDGSSGGNLFFQYVFASEEYIDFVDSAFNDVFALFVDGVNIALLPDGVTPVTINNVNGSNNSAFYLNNVENTDGFLNLGLDTAFDGLTTVLTATALNLAPGTHTMKFAVADTGDGILDAGVFIKAGSFSTDDPDGGNGSIPLPSTLLLIGIGLAGLSFTRRKKVI